MFAAFSSSAKRARGLHLLPGQPHILDRLADGEIVAVTRCRIIEGGLCDVRTQRKAGEQIPIRLQQDRHVAPCSFRRSIVAFIAHLADEIDVRRKIESGSELFFAHDRYLAVALLELRVSRQRNIDGRLKRIRNQVGRGHRLVQFVDLRRYVEGLRIFGEGVLERAFETDAALICPL